MEPIGVMQLADSLSAGGLEKVAVNLANQLDGPSYRCHLCVTRNSGPLEGEICPNVRFLNLGRHNRFDLSAIHRLATYIRDHRIQILHAHGTSLFIAVAATALRRGVKVLWHDHYGRFETESRNAVVYRVAAAATEGIISVSEPLAAWAKTTLKKRPERVWYISNFASFSSVGRSCKPLTLPGKKGFRIVCVANLRPEKNHLNLLRAFKYVVKKVPEAHLLLVGAANDPAILEGVENAIFESNLCSNVTWLGVRSDVQSILKESDIGVLSSSSEGLPLSLIEYGMAGLPVVATNVGQCGDVLDKGRAGLLVPPSSPEALAHALLLLLQSWNVRREMAASFSSRVAQYYTADVAIKRITEIYSILVGSSEALRQ